MLEKDLNKKIRTALHDPPDTVCWRNHGGPHSIRGLPDIVGCSEGLMFAFEVKLPGEEKNLTPLQAKKLRDLEAAGAIVAVVTTVKQGRRELAVGKKKAKGRALQAAREKLSVRAPTRG
jgi:hypothetical protein